MYIHSVFADYKVTCPPVLIMILYHCAFNFCLLLSTNLFLFCSPVVPPPLLLIHASSVWGGCQQYFVSHWARLPRGGYWMSRCGWIISCLVSLGVRSCRSCGADPVLPVLLFIVPTDTHFSFLSSIIVTANSNSAESAQTELLVLSFTEQSIKRPNYSILKTSRFKLCVLCLWFWMVFCVSALFCRYLTLIVFLSLYHLAPRHCLSDIYIESVQLFP